MFKRVLHPGGLLKEEVDALGVTPTEFARQIEVPPNRVSRIIAGKRPITGTRRWRCNHWFGTEPQFWPNLQAQFALALADRQIGKRHPSSADQGGGRLRARQG